MKIAKYLLKISQFSILKNVDEHRICSKNSGGASSKILVRLKGGIIFWVDFYCIFGRFEEILVRLEPHGPHC